MNIENIKKGLDLYCFAIWMFLLGAFLESSRWGWFATSCCFAVFFAYKVWKRLFE